MVRSTALRLGFWNRLAIVASSLGSIGGATWMVLSANNASSKAREDGYSFCMEGLSRPGTDLTPEYCGELWLGKPLPLGWTHWFETIGGLLLLSGAIYILIAATAWVARWVWRGRSVSKT